MNDWVICGRALAVEEARDIADRLRCQPLLDRASRDSLGLSRA